MQTKNTLTLVVMLITLVIVSSTVQAQMRLTTQNGEDDVGHTPVLRLGKGATIAGLIPIDSFLTSREGLKITSLCSINSASDVLQQSRKNAMGGLLGSAVSMNRSLDPAAWYAIALGGVSNVWGLQWYDVVNTTNSTFWEGVGNGTNGLSATQRGHQVVGHCWGENPASAYWFEVTTTITNIAPVTFNVATNTFTGLEIEFNDNFIGFHEGANGVWESYWDPSLGRPVAGGDDVVFTSGLPSTNSYTRFVRFGSRTSVTVGSAEDPANVRRQFGEGHQSLTMKLTKNNVVPSTSIARTVYEAIPRILIWNNPPGLIRLQLEGGQLNTLYGVQWRESFTNAPWTNQPGLNVKSGVPWDAVNQGSQGYVRVYQRAL